MSISACFGKKTFVQGYWCSLNFLNLSVLENKFYHVFDIVQKLFPLDVVSFLQNLYLYLFFVTVLVFRLSSCKLSGGLEGGLKYGFG